MHTTRRAALALLLAICVALLSACGARPQSAQQPADVSLPQKNPSLS